MLLPLLQVCHPDALQSQKTVLCMPRGGWRNFEILTGLMLDYNIICIDIHFVFTHPSHDEQSLHLTFSCCVFLCDWPLTRTNLIPRLIWIMSGLSWGWCEKVCIYQILRLIVPYTNRQAIFNHCWAFLASRTSIPSGTFRMSGWDGHGLHLVW